MIETASLLLIAVVVLGLAFDYVNGFHDSANAIATVVSTRALSPRQAVILAGCMNFCGAFLFQGVAETISKGLLDTHSVGDNQLIILTALLGAILWNLLTWWLGLPSSSSHALVGGLVGSAIFYRGFHAVIWSGVVKKVVVPGIVSPLLGLMCGFLVMLAILWIFRRANPHVINARFRKAQWVSASFMALAHGTNDAQKVMGVITLALVTAGHQTDFHIPTWVKVGCATMMALGTSAGGWRIIKTLGCNVVKMQPVNGFAADLTSSTLLLTTAHLGMPVSTTHVISASIMGVGATRRLSAVRWGVAGNILTAWVLTLPASALAAGVAFVVIRFFVHQ
jgi:PiT family inorganic phosphate transporter